jgi:hypothetical protein
MMQTTFERNKQILMDVLSGTSFDICAQQHHITRPTVSNAIRTVLDSLVEHTEYSLSVSTTLDFLQENKAVILHHLKEPIPIVPITTSAKALLQEKFGRFYARVPEKVAEQWPACIASLNYYHHKRDINSIQQWLASEGYLVGNYVNEAMQEFANDVLLRDLSNYSKTENEVGFTIDHIKQQGNALILETTLTKGTHRAKRRWCIEMLPE